MFAPHCAPRRTAAEVHHQGRAKPRKRQRCPGGGGNTPDKGPKKVATLPLENLAQVKAGSASRFHNETPAPRRTSSPLGSGHRTANHGMTQAPTLWPPCIHSSRDPLPRRPTLPTLRPLPPRLPAISFATLFHQPLQDQNKPPLVAFSLPNAPSESLFKKKRFCHFLSQSWPRTPDPKRASCASIQQTSRALAAAPDVAPGPVFTAHRGLAVLSAAATAPPTLA